MVFPNRSSEVGSDRNSVHTQYMKAGISRSHAAMSKVHSCYEIYAGEHDIADIGNNDVFCGINVEYGQFRYEVDKRESPILPGFCFRVPTIEE